jgi:hypothetical protein
VVTLEREAAPGRWIRQADSFGDIQTTLQYPADVIASTATYRSGSFAWKWTAHFEAFDSDIDTARFGNQTPTGRYRYVVNGKSRHGHATVPYRVQSNTFDVQPWQGITVPDIRVEPDRTVSFAVGPTYTRRYSTQEYRGENDPTKVKDVAVGPIAYPDTYTTASEYPAAPETGNHLYPRIERNVITDSKTGAEYRYCFPCTFRPWAETGRVASARVQIGRGTRQQVVVAKLGGDGRFHTTARLAAGQTAQVARGGIRDTFGETNGAASAMVTALAARPALVGSYASPPARGAAGSSILRLASATGLPAVVLAAGGAVAAALLIALAAAVLARFRSVRKP